MPETEKLGKKKEQEKEEQTERNILSDLVLRLNHDFGPAIKKIEVKDVRIGLAYTGVLISGNCGGIACTPIYEFSGCPSCCFLDSINTTKGKTADEALELVFSKNPIETAVGVATINALSHMLQELKPEKFENFYCPDLDVLDLIKPEDRIAMVGYFEPLVPKIMKITEKLTVLEKREIEGAKTKTLPSERAEETLPDSDVIILSASTLANRTFDELLSYCNKAREVILLGPSTPLYPEIFFERGITSVMGTRIFDPEAMLTIVSEAGGTRKLHKYCGQKVAFRKRE
ncbi:MAG: Rossmann-like domain-containing protein [Methanosarcina sp.]